MPEIVRTMPPPFPRLLVWVLALFTRSAETMMAATASAKSERPTSRLSSILTKTNAMLIALCRNVQTVISLLWHAYRVYILISAACLIILLMLLTSVIW